MRCPFCACENTQVKDSRPTEENAAIRRRRICPDCGGRFTTFERVQLRELIIVKRSGRKVPFDRDKLVNSVSVALRKRPVDAERIERMISGIVRQLESSGETEIPSATIGELVMDALRAVDPVAYVRFASVYRDFRNAADFADVLGEIARDAVPPADAAALAEAWNDGGDTASMAAGTAPHKTVEPDPKSAMPSVSTSADAASLPLKNH